MKTFYRTYRPQNFAEIVNQNHIKISISHQLETDSFTHAYLFCGPRGIGKTTIARIFAKALNCQKRKKGEHEPCNECQACRDLNIGRNMDVLEIDAASHTGVDNVRENIISASRVASAKDKYKVFIIDEVHMLSVSAFNALLKVLEEPPERVVFILCTTEAHKIPETIISRTQRFDFKRIGAADVVKKLQYIANKEKIEIDSKVLENIARESGGHMRDAESILGQVVSIGGKKISLEDADLVIPKSDTQSVIELLEYLAKKDAGSAISLVNKLLDDGISLKRFSVELLEILRKLMLLKIDHRLGEKLGLMLGESMEMRVSKLGSALSLDYIMKMIRVFLESKTELKKSFIVQLPLELAIAGLCSPGHESQNKNLDQQDMPSGVSGNLAKQSLETKKSISPINTRQDAEQEKATAEQTPIASTPPIATKQINNTNSSNSVSMSREEVKAKWGEVLAKIKKHNHSLSFILRVCEPREVSGGKMCLAFKYKFHKNRINELSIRKMVEKVIVEVYACHISIEAIVDEALAMNNGVSNNSYRPASDTASDSLLPEENGEPQATESVKDEEKKSGGENLLKNVLDTFGGKVI